MSWDLWPFLFGFLAIGLFYLGEVWKFESSTKFVWQICRSLCFWRNVKKPVIVKCVTCFSHLCRQRITRQKITISQLWKKNFIEEILGYIEIVSKSSYDVIMNRNLNCSRWWLVLMEGLVGHLQNANSIVYRLEVSVSCLHWSALVHVFSPSGNRISTTTNIL